MSQSQLNITIDRRSPVPRYEQICQQFRQRIEARQLKPGTLLPTNLKLSSQLQINYSTAQRAMATLAKEGYVIRQARRGTTVKGIPRRDVVGIYSYTKLISQDAGYEYYRLVTDHLCQQLKGSARIHRLYLSSEEKTPANVADEDLLQHLRSGVLCGVLLVNAYRCLEELVQIGRSLSIPVVALSGSGDLDYSVRADLRGYVRDAAAYLQQQGRRRVGVIYNSSSPSFQDPSIIVRILKDAGCVPVESWVMGGIDTEGGGYDAARCLPLDEIDGLIVQDDVMALGVDRRLCEVNLNVPRDLMVTTFWNRGNGRQLTQPFERFEVDVANQARLSLRMLEDVISGQRIAEPHSKIAATHFNQGLPDLARGRNLELNAPIR